MSSVFFFGGNNTVTSTQGAESSGQASAKSRESSAPRVDFNGLLALFAVQEQGEADVVGTTMGSWSMEQGTEGDQQQAETAADVDAAQADNEAAHADRGELSSATRGDAVTLSIPSDSAARTTTSQTAATTPASPSQAVERLSAQPAADDGVAAAEAGRAENADVEIGGRERLAPIPVAWARDLGMTANPEATADITQAPAPTQGSIAPTQGPDPELEGVHPELQQRLTRVIQRMESEYGHRVEVLEGYRTPERQLELYAQGRSAPGPVVTWTTHSQHSDGRAVDLRVDGTWDAPEAYRHLQQIAREEGLGTLGMRDPGHLELRDGTAARMARPGADANPSDSGSGRSTDGQSRNDGRGTQRPTVARAARVASVANVANVARAARVATPGVRQSAQRSADTFEIPAEPAPIRAPDLGDISVESQVESRVASMAPTATPSGGFQQGTQGAGPVGGISADAMSGVERVMDIQDALEAMTPTSATIRLDGIAGPVETVRVSLADRALDAWMDVRGTGQAETMRAGLADLYQALESRGYDPGTLSVNALAGSEGSLEAALANRGDMAASVLRSFLDGIGATTSSRGTGSEPGQQEQRQTSQGRSEQDGFNRSRRDDRRNQK